MFENASVLCSRAVISTPRLIAFSGSLRAQSYNHLLVTVAAEAARSAGAEVTILRLADYPLPLLNQDVEAAHGLPEPARRLKTLFREHDGFLIASPEYNSSLSAALKNVIDWTSRVETEDEPPLVAFRGKSAGLLATSPGGLGGVRGLVHLRSILGNIGVIVHPDQITLPAAMEAFDENGALKESSKVRSVERFAAGVVELTRKLRA